MLLLTSLLAGKEFFFFADCTSFEIIIIAIMHIDLAGKDSRRTLLMGLQLL